MEKFLTKEQILGINDLKIVTLYVKDWDAEVRLKTLSSSERDAFERQVFARGDMEKADLDNFRAKLVALVLVDNNGKRIFNNPKDVEELGRKSANALDFIFNKAQELCGLTTKDVEDLTKK